MIQACSQCGTRWNVRERQRTWCPRCRGTLMRPQADVPAGPSGVPSQRPPAAGVAGRGAPRIPPGFRWIALRPGVSRRAGPGRRPLGPTPRYAAVPRWGLIDPARYLVPAPVAEQQTQTGPPAERVRAVLLATQMVFAAAALVYAGRYVLLIINRETLLNSVLALTADWMGIAASGAALVAAAAAFVVLVQWLRARRAAAFSHHGLLEHRTARRLWAGCLLPFVNLVMAPLYVIELALVEGHYRRMRKPIIAWWLIWVLSYAVSLFAIATCLSSDAQGIANNTVAVTIGYLVAGVTIAAVSRVFEGFERKPVVRPAHRWLVVESGRPEKSTPSASSAVVEPEGRQPAA
ncbi:DUF4328 domain-containing protein [Mycobacterium sp.]|uniref:DUF4328 domain-containing protein n=1 Tax=Mycobacterium sp. TaxID=1785 RepID=UPI003A8653E4